MDIALIVEILQFGLAIGGSIGLIAIGWFFGRRTEKRHLADLDRREALVKDMIVTNAKSLPPNWKCAQTHLVESQVVIGADAFKSFIMQIVNFFGGEQRGLGTLMLRARREALLRIVEDAQAQGANAVWNVRYETSTIGRSLGGNKGLAMAEIMAYGTALWITPDQ